MRPEAKLSRLACRQASVFTYAQAAGCGLSPATIRNRCARGLWSPLHRGVFLFASVERTWIQDAWAAVLACGGVAAFRTAGKVWRFVEASDRPEILVPEDRCPRRPGIDVHRTERLDRVYFDGLPVTSPMRTILDLAGCLDGVEVARIVDLAHRTRLIDLGRFVTYLASDFARSRPGAGALREIVAVRDPNRPIGSHLESDLFGVLRRAGLPLPIPQYPVDTRSGLRFIDFAFPEQRLAIEADGFGPHSSRDAFEVDRIRQNEIEELGWHFRRITDRQLKHDPNGVAITIGLGLQLRPVRWR